MRQILSTALVALVVGSLAGATVGALAQSPDEAEAGAGISPSAVSRINADRVDGKHAVGAGASVTKRAGKLVATNKQGYLPKNIVNGLVTDLQITTVQSPVGNTTSAGSFMSNSVVCPEGSVVVGGGFSIAGNVLVHIYASRALTDRLWRVEGWNRADNGSVTLWAYASCLSVGSGGASIASARSEYGPAKLKVREP
jgi:hypothetical protein